MACLVKEIAEPDHACSLTDKVHCQCGIAAAEDARDRVQFLATIPQVIAGYNEIGGAESCVGCKQNAIVAIPKPVFGVRMGRRDRLERLDHRGWSDRSGLEQSVGDLLLG